MSGKAFDDLIRSTKSTEVIGERAMTAVRVAFPDQALDHWTFGLEQLVEAKIGSGTIINFATASAAVARAHGPDLALTTVPVALSIARLSGARAASDFFSASAKAAVRLKEHTAFRTWLRVALT